MHRFLAHALRWLSPLARRNGRRSHGHLLVRRLYFRALGGISLVAFASLWRQIDALLGSRGITPAHDFLSRVRERLPRKTALRLVPSLLWIDSSDRALHALCGAGTVGSALLVFGIAPQALCAFLWADYLSLVSVGDVFLGYQWDALLLETYFTSLFLAPRHARRRLADREAPSAIALWSLRFLLFKLMFLSGFSKLSSRDRTWRDLSALTYHYQTQPLPTGIAPRCHQFAPRLHAASTLAMFGAELCAPFLAFGTRTMRLGCAAATLTLQLGIALTGNYGFFNWLTAALTLPLLDDQALLAALPQSLRARLHLDAPPPRPIKRSIFRRAVFAVLAASASAISLAETARRLGRLRKLTAKLASVMERIQPLRTINTYGLFAIMTTERPEIIVEGSADGVTWRPYEFKWKPGRVDRAPRMVAPHQPRLDWQMWFAALDTWRRNPWFLRFVKKLLEGEPAVLKLLDDNPFPDAPPRLMRARLFDYRFASREERKRGVFWTRKLLGNYCPVFMLMEDGTLGAVS